MRAWIKQQYTEEGLRHVASMQGNRTNVQATRIKEREYSLDLYAGNILLNLNKGEKQKKQLK